MLPPSTIAPQFLSYLVVGGLAFVVDIAGFAILHGVGLPWPAASAAAFALATAANYVLSYRLAFRRGRFGRFEEVSRLLTVAGIGLALNTGFVWLFVSGFAMAPLAAKVVAVPLVLVWNFLGRRQLVFYAEMPTLTRSTGSRIAAFCHRILYCPRQKLFAATVIALTAASYVLVSTGYGIWRAYSALPYHDALDLTIGFIHWSIRISDTNSWKHLLIQWNEHRIVISKIIMLIDLQNFDGFGIFPLLLSLVCQILNLSVVYTVTSRCYTGGKFILILLAGIMVIPMYSATNMETFRAGFQIQFTLVFMLSNFSFLMMTMAHQLRTAESRILHPTFFVVALLMAALATFTMANGILVWIILLAQSVWMQVRRRYFAITLTCASAIVFAYFWDFQFVEGHEDFTQAVRKPWNIIAYIGIYLGAPMTFHSEVFAAPVGFLGVGLSTMLAWRQWRSRPLRTEADRCRLILLCIMAFVIGTAAVTAIGRVDFGIGQATTGRYAISALLFWTALLGLLLTDASGTGGRRRRVAAIVTGIVLVPLIVRQATDWDDYRRAKLDRDLVASALFAEIVDQDAFGRIHGDASRVVLLGMLLRRDRKSVFAEDWAWHVGRPMAADYRTVPARHCLGRFDATAPIASDAAGRRVKGWAWDAEAGEAPARVLLVDPQDRVAGIAFTGWVRADVAADHAAIGGRETGWRGVARVPPGGTVLRAFAVTGDGREACPLSGSHEVRTGAAG